MSIWQLILLFSLTIGGSLLVFVFEGNLQKYLKPFLAFSGAYLFGITIMHLFPEIFSHGNRFTAMFVLVGFTIQIFLEALTKGVEHGHLHIHNPGRYLPWTISLGLSVHSFLEGMPLAETFSHGHMVSQALYFGIVLHKIPAAFVLFAVLKDHGIKNSTAWPVLLLFAMMTPLGVIFAETFFPHETHDSQLYKILLALVIGAFLHISTTILFEAGEKHKYNFKKAIGIVIGFILAYFTTGFSGH